MPFTYTREFTDDETKALEHFVADVKQWIDDAIAGKIHSCQKRILQSEITDAITKRKSLPVDPLQIVSDVFARPGYKNRAQLDAEESAVPVEIEVAKEGDGQPA